LEAADTLKHSVFLNLIDLLILLKLALPGFPYEPEHEKEAERLN
jgi:hypothetical protein